MTIEGIKLIRHNTSGIDIPDDTTYPFKLEVSLRAAEFMSFAFISLIGGTEEIVVRGMTKEVLQEFVKLNNLEKHPRLIKLEIS